ncbi:MAG TPA: PspC domain-containing protein [Pseudonocardiaceae bacterium]|jgi:phage shock protein PspC (stress-responsive transcriptional regulator)
MSENPYYAANPQTSAPVRRFLRSRDDRMIAGVCGGAARYFGIDATLLRLLLVIAAILGVGTGALVYLACWLLVPEEA